MTPPVTGTAGAPETGTAGAPETGTAGVNLLPNPTTPPVTIEEIRNLCTQNQLRGLTHEDLKNFQKTIMEHRWAYRGTDQNRITQDGTALYNLARQYGLRPTLAHLTADTNKWKALATKLCLRLKRAQASNQN